MPRFFKRLLTCQETSTQNINNQEKVQQEDDILLPLCTQKKLTRSIAKARMLHIISYKGTQSWPEIVSRCARNFAKYTTHKSHWHQNWLFFLPLHCKAPCYYKSRMEWKNRNNEEPGISPNAVIMKIGNYKSCIEIARHSNSIAYLQCTYSNMRRVQVNKATTLKAFHVKILQKIKMSKVKSYRCSLLIQATICLNIYVTIWLR